jgi:hypothetical protein
LKRLLTTALLLLLIFSLVAPQLPVHAKEIFNIGVRSEYTLNRYGFATINETVTFVNNSTAPAVPPSIQIGLGNLSAYAVVSGLTGSQFSMNGAPAGGPFTVQTSQPMGSGVSASFTISTLLQGVVSTAKNGSLEVLTLSQPAVNSPVRTIQEVVKMPASTTFVSAPAGLSRSQHPANNTYSNILSNQVSPSALSSVRAVTPGSGDFHPLVVYRASRTFSVGQSGVPLVTDSIYFKNLGTTALTQLYVSALAPEGSQVTILPGSEPRLLNPAKVSLAGGAISLSASGGRSSVAAGSNYTLVFQYALDPKYYTVSGGQVTLSIPQKPPIPAVVGQYAIGIDLQPGVSVLKGPPQPLTNANPRQGGSTTIAYGLTVGWALDGGIPAASVIFVLLVIGLFVSKTTLTEEEETEEETSTERSSAMIKAFDEKTSLINGLWPEIEGKDPSELGREYFGELRGRLDAFRSRALQRLNEIKQKSTTQKFFDLLNQIHATEREVDRAAKDKLNLYEQYYQKRMRKDVFDRLLPQYTKRLEKALNQLTDELHIVQREAKLL